MKRLLIRETKNDDGKAKQHNKPVGWYCIACGNMISDPMIKKCHSCGSLSTYKYKGSPKWHNAPEGLLCHKCYSAKVKVKS